jgi:hypothetical protein
LDVARNKQKTFVIGVIPVAITVNPNLYLKFDASVKGSAHLKCKYDYSNRFKAWAGTKIEILGNSFFGFCVSEARMPERGPTGMLSVLFACQASPIASLARSPYNSSC